MGQGVRVVRQIKKGIYRFSKEKKPVCKVGSVTALA